MEKPSREISYLEIFKQAMKLAWSNRYLWWFGFFITLSGIIISVNPFGGETKPEINQQATDFLLAHKLAILIGIVLVLLIFLAFAILSAISRGALIKSLDAACENRKSNFKSAFHEGRINFWKILSIQVAIGFFGIASAIILIAPVAFLFYAQSFVIGSLLAIIALLILIPLFFITAYLRIFGYLYSILGNLGLWQAMENAYSLLTKNLRPSIIMLFLFIPINILFGIAVIISVIPVIIASFLIGLVLFFIINKAGIMIAAGLAILISSVLFLAMKSVYEVFAQAAWLLFFREIAKPEEDEKITEKEKDPDAMPAPTPLENI